jgi:hypothetical protein
VAAHRCWVLGSLALLAACYASEAPSSDGAVTLDGPAARDGAVSTGECSPVQEPISLMWHRDVDAAVDETRLGLDATGAVWAFGNPRSTDLWIAGPGVDGMGALVPLSTASEIREHAVAIDDEGTAFLAVTYRAGGGLVHRVFRYDFATRAMAVHVDTGAGQAYDLAFDPSGNLLVAADSIADAPTDAGVSKYAPDGTLLWRWPGEPTTLRVQFAEPDASGNVYVLHTVRPVRDNERALSKLSPSGELAWQVVLEDWLVNPGLGVSPDGVAYVAGAVNRELPPLPPPMDPSLDLRVHAIRTDGSEAWQWQGQPSNVGPNDTRVVLDLSGQIFVTWYQRPTDPSASSLVLDRFSPEGELCWSRTGADLFPADLVIGASGDIFVATLHSYARVLP